MLARPGPRGFRSDRRPGFGRRLHRIEPERQRTDDAPVLFQQARARRAYGDVTLNAYLLGALERSQDVRGEVLDGMFVLFSHGLPTPPRCGSMSGQSKVRSRSIASRVRLLIVPSGVPSSRAISVCVNPP